MRYEDLSPLLQWFLAITIDNSPDSREIADSVHDHGANIVLTVNGYELNLDVALERLVGSEEEIQQRVDALLDVS